jgi:hypothetical protein
VVHKTAGIRTHPDSSVKDEYRNGWIPNWLELKDPLEIAGFQRYRVADTEVHLSPGSGYTGLRVRTGSTEAGD